MSKLNEKIERIKAAHNIVDVISKDVPLKQEGERWTGLCPFHDECTPSFNIYTNTQKYYCFGCQESGDVIDYLMNTEGKSFTEVIKSLATDGSDDDYILSEEDIAEAEKNWVVETILTLTANYYHSKLTKEAKDYLINERGLTLETIDKFLIGYADGGLCKHLLEKGFSVGQCLEVGVIKDADNPVDYFNGQIILPNIKGGKVVYLTGRAMNGTEPRYLNLGLAKSHLFNEDVLKSEKVVVITEGIFDALSATQNGFPAIGLLGCDLKESHVKKFNKVETVYVGLDGDQTGKDNSASVADNLGRKAKIVTLPEATDLNEFFMGHSPDAFKKLLEEAQDSIEYRVNEIEPLTKKTSLFEKLKSVLEQLASIEAPTAESYLSGLIADRFKLSSDELSAYRQVVKEMRKEFLIKEEANRENASAPIEDKTCRNKFSPLSGDELYKIEKEKLTYIVDKYIPEGRLVLLSGSPKDGKTTVAYHIIKHVTEGTPFLGYQTLQSKVLILALEEHPQDVSNRLKKHGVKGSMVKVHCGSLKSTAEILREIEKFVIEDKCKLIVIDTLSAFWNVTEENSASQTRPALTPITEVARKAGAAIILIHHSTKENRENGKDIRGSGDILANADVSLVLKRYGNHDSSSRLLIYEGRYDDIPKRIVISLDNGIYTNLGDAEKYERTEEPQAIMNALTDEPVEPEDITEALGTPVGTVRTILGNLYKKGKVSRTGKGKKGNPYKYSKIASAHKAPLECTTIQEAQVSDGDGSILPTRNGLGSGTYN